MVAPVALTFTDAAVLGPAGLTPGPLSIADGVITEAVQPRRIALPDHQIMPGIVDLHGDGFERHLAPRRGLMQDLTRGLAALDAELAACGITTAVLAQFWSWEGGMRSAAFARKLADALRVARPHLFTDMHLQLRLETHMIDDFEEVAAFVEAEGIGYVVFNDHLPHKALRAGKRPPRLNGQAVKGGRSPEAHLELLQRLEARTPEVPDALNRLAATLTSRGVRLGSHDDPDPTRRSEMRACRVDIAEFPETLETVRSAHAAGGPVLLGAPNVVRGGSHAGKMDARAAVADGICDALVSDYHYPSLVAGVQALSGGQPAALAHYWTLISQGPATVMDWRDRGHLGTGARADLTILGPGGLVEATICAGRISCARGSVAAALLGC